MTERPHPDPDERRCPDVASRSRWPADLTRVCERMVERLMTRGGVDHPVAAAVVLVARGHLGLDRDAFASQLGLAPDAVAAAEAGRIPWEDLPDVVGDLLESMPRVELLALADLDREFRTAATSAEPAATTPHDTAPSDTRLPGHTGTDLADHGDDGHRDDGHCDDGRAAAP